MSTDQGREENDWEEAISLGDDVPHSQPSSPAVAPAPPPMQEAPVGASLPNTKMQRDRIVILGRRRSGKTIFLARVYQKLWNSRDSSIHMRALDGNSHMSLMRIIGTLDESQWPAATGGNTYSSFEVTYQEEKIPLVMLDYPGEVFRRAFVDGVMASDTKELVEHVDRALGIICLVDPGNILEGDLEEVADDEFGMVQALDRVRRSVGGVDVPIALVLTKCDIHAKRIKRLGGLRRFVEGRMLNVLRVAGRFKYFGAAAVRSTTDARDKDVPDMRKPPVNVIEPLTWCIEQVVVNRKQKEQHAARALHEQQAREFLAAEEASELDAERRNRAFWTWIIVLGTLAATTLIGWALYSISQQ